MNDIDQAILPPEEVKPKRSIVGTITLLFIFLISVAALAGVYLMWEKSQQSQVKQQLNIRQFNQDIKSLFQGQDQLKLQNTQQIQNIQSFQEKLRENLTRIVSNNQYFRNDWLIAEAEYLIQLANYRILLEKDVVTAAVALKEADQRLAEVDDPALIKIREILKNDLQALNNVQTIDLAGLSVTISALSNNIENMPLNTPDPTTHKITKVQTTSASTEVKELKDLPAAIWKDIKGLLVVRNHQKEIQPLLAPEQHFFLVQNLALLLEQTRLALLNGHSQIYQERLETTKKWIKLYFDNDHNITINMLNTLSELQKVNIDPALPDISSTYSAVKKYRTQINLPKVPTLKGKNK
ncbi:MAG: uroporphyrinogen-III C-methyltransferase [Woeseiaceae bacterium]